jgi:phosphoenolpyruvate carboxylase
VRRLRAQIRVPGLNIIRLDVRSHNAERQELLSEITASSDQVETMRATTVAPGRNGRAGVETLL